VKFTTREKLENMLIDRGMSYTQASEVIELSIPELNKLSEYHIDFDSINNYPELM
jgi:DNA-binding Xre family transcriptional regulator